MALKVLPASALANQDDRARFYREARAAAALKNAHIATVYEIDEAVPRTAQEITPQEIDEAVPRTAQEITPQEIDEAVPRTAKNHRD